MKFKYTALGANNQKLEGILEAATLDAARDQLHKMNFSVVAINEVSAEEEAALASEESITAKSKEGIKTFYFMALDPQKKDVNGTIDSKDPYLAYRRLFTEYQFEVLDLYPDGSLDPAGESLKPQFEEWKRTMEDEGIDFSKKVASGVKNELEEGGKVDEEIVAEMDQFIINTKTVLKDFRGQYSDVLLREIERVLGEIERIRASNNLKHITKLCNELFELIANPDASKAGNEEEEDEKYNEAVTKIKSSGFIANRFQLLRAHKSQQNSDRFDKLQLLFTKILAKVSGKKGEEFSNQFEQKIKGRHARWLSRLTRNLKGNRSDSHPTLMLVISKFFNYAAAPNQLLRRARKQEMIKAYHEWQKYRKEPRKAKPKPSATGGAEGQTDELPVSEPSKPKKDFSPFFAELDSFVGWLLFFYITYFFLVSFSIEKNVGLSKELVFKTLASPLIFNISLFLVVAHLAFTLKIRFFRSNFLGSLFLFFLTFGLYTILIINF